MHNKKYLWLIHKILKIINVLNIQKIFKNIDNNVIKLNKMLYKKNKY